METITIGHANVEPSKTHIYTTFGQLFDTMQYPAGESHLALAAATRTDLNARGRLVIETRATNFGDLAQVVTADDVLQRHGVHAQWFLPYFPFARHDRRNHCGDGFELGVALDMMRHLDIVIADPHSDVAGQLPHIPQSASVECFRDAGLFAESPVVVIPDAGATKKAFAWADGPVVQAVKHREPATGRLSGFEVLADDLGGASCVIVDDICDGGGTFLGLAQALADKNAGPLTLAVTHGLFTKGTAALRCAFDRIVSFGFADQNTFEPGVDYLPYQDLYNQGARR